MRDEQPVTDASGNPVATTVAIVRTEDLGSDSIPNLVTRPVLTLFLYRLDFNMTLRAAWSGVSQNDGRSHLRLTSPQAFLDRCPPPGVTASNTRSASPATCNDSGVPGCDTGGRRPGLSPGRAWDRLRDSGCDSGP